MEKIMDLTPMQFEMFEKSKNQVKFAKELLGIKSKAKIGIGDTATLVDNAKALEVYKRTWNGENTYYIVINPMDEKAAMCYSIYPKM